MARIVDVDDVVGCGLCDQRFESVADRGAGGLAVEKLADVSRREPEPVDENVAGEADVVSGPVEVIPAFLRRAVVLNADRSPNRRESPSGPP
jgi:hypothetical protein